MMVMMMRVVVDEDEGVYPDKEENKVNLDLIMYAKKDANLSSSVEKSQVDGGFDSLSSISQSPEPSRLSLDEPFLPLPARGDYNEMTKTKIKGKEQSQLNVIQKRMKQSNFGKDKPGLLKHVFFAVNQRLKLKRGAQYN